MLRCVVDRRCDGGAQSVERGEVKAKPAALFARQPMEDQAKQIADAVTPADAREARPQRFPMMAALPITNNTMAVIT